MAQINNNQNYSINSNSLTYKVEGSTNPGRKFNMCLYNTVNPQSVVQTWENQNYFTLGYHSITRPEGNELSVRVWQLPPEGFIAGSLGCADRSINLDYPLNGTRFTIVFKPDAWFPGDITEIFIREGE